MALRLGSNFMSFRFLKKSLSVIVAVLLVSCAEPKDDKALSSQVENANSNTRVLEILEKAEKVHEHAVMKEHAWTVTVNHIQAARNALASGDTEDALLSANRALLTANASLSQADREEKAWQARVLKTKN